MPDDTSLSAFHGQGVLHSGLGSFEVKGDLNIGVSRNCLSDLFVTDPRHDKERIEQAKGGLLRDVYCWILENNDFLRWHSDSSGLLWVRGDPGKGKTMLLCGIINELENQKQTSNTTHVLSFFFCQATDPRLNNATAVLRGLIYLIIRQQPSLISHVEEVYNRTGKEIFEGVNAWIALRKILENILQDPNLPDTTFVIDALDECETGLSLLLDLITVSSKVKWIVSSRNRIDIEERLYSGTQHIRSLWLELRLELNESSVSESVCRYIQHEVDRLTKLKKYNDELREVVQNYLALHANDTFLWVALVCQALADPKVRLWHTHSKLREFPPGLDSLYDRMIDQITESYDAESCKRILSVMSIVYRPLSLQELAPLVGFPEDLEEMVELCGSFLVLREGTVSFIHQSAKDYLLQHAAGKISRSNTRDKHHTVCQVLLELMSQRLQRDIYSLDDWGIPPGEIKPPEPDPLAAMRYSCIYWVDHLAECQHSEQTQYNSLQDNGMVDRFLRKHYLHWLEALSILKSLSQGVLAISKLKRLIPGETTQLSKLIHDAHRFIRHNILAIESSPLQVYASALLFSPRQSLVRTLFKDEKPLWLASEPAIEDQWSACIVTFEGHGNCDLLVLSPDGSKLALNSDLSTIKICDIETGAYLLTLRSHEHYVHSATFSPDGARLASWSDEDSVRIWDMATGVCLTTIVEHGPVNSVALSPSGGLLASSSRKLLVDGRDSITNIWDVATGACLRTLLGHDEDVLSVAFSPNGELLASGSLDSTAKMWDVTTGECLTTIVEHGPVHSVAFSPDGNQLASGSSEGTIGLWDMTGTRLVTLEGHESSVHSVAFLGDENHLASHSGDYETRIWDTKTRACLMTFQGHSFYSMAFSLNGRVASILTSRMVKVWDGLKDVGFADVTKHGDCVEDIAFSPHGNLVASISSDGTARIWSAKTGKCLEAILAHVPMDWVDFSTDGWRLITDIGIMPLPIPLALYTVPLPTPSSQRPPMRYQFEIRQYTEWIICNGQKLVWLPPEYRPHRSAVHAQTIAIGCLSGLVWTLNFSFPLSDVRFDGESGRQSSWESDLDLEIETDTEVDVMTQRWKRRHKGESDDMEVVEAKTRRWWKRRHLNRSGSRSRS